MSLPAQQTQLIESYRGEAVELDFTPPNPTDITDWTLAATVVKTAGAVVSLSAVPTITTAAAGAFKVLFSGTDTKGLAAGSYEWDVWRTDAGSEKRLAGGRWYVYEPDRQP